jgi:hypothetical protein
MDFKEFADSLDKLTDILNVGRLIFYTAAGFCASLPCAMTLRLLARENPKPYWRQFLEDMTAGSKHPGVWLVALVSGFVIAAVGYVLTLPQLNQTQSLPSIGKDRYVYQYPRLFSGGVRPEKGKDYAAWLVSEYYRYLEIVWYIPIGILIALPVFSLYSLFYLVRTDHAGGFAFTTAHLAFGAWTLGAVVAWDVAWSRFWVPRIIQPYLDDWREIVPSTVAGLEDFVKESATPPQSPEQGR